ncbi:hypothetical protein H8E07_19365 [bacterium]|nr:hypothetical protein [bacterium]
MNEREIPQDGYECVDPDLGGELWRLDDPETNRALRGRLEVHVSICARCRLQLATEDWTRSGLRSERIVLRGERSRTRITPLHLGGFGAMALAAGIALVFLLPAGTLDKDMLVRGNPEQPAITRPIPGEVVHGNKPRIEWTPIADATSYRVTLRQVDGSHEWSHETTDPQACVTDDALLATSARYRVLLETVPAYLASGGGLHSSFRTGTTGEFMRYRLGTAPAWAIALGALGAILGGLGAFWRVFRHD